MNILDDLKSYFIVLYDSLPKRTITTFAKTPHKQLFRYHYTIGLSIRNTLLANNESLTRAFLNAGIESTDDMSALIINLFHVYVNAK